MSSPAEPGAPWPHVLLSLELFGAMAVASAVWVAYVPPRARDLPPDEVPYHIPALRELIEELHEHAE